MLEASDIANLDQVLLRAAREGAREALAAQPKARQWLSTKSAAAYLDTTEDAIRSAVKRRQLPFHKSGSGRLLFRPQELDKFAQALDREAA